MDDREKEIIRETSHKHPDGDGDTHIHLYNDGVTITDRFSGGTVHTNFDKDGNFKDIEITR